MNSRGKWSQAGVPHSGWSCTDVEDLEDGREICEMCESQEIRYVHYMRHPSYTGTLACGCDCAGHMEGNLSRADTRDKSMRNAARRRMNFPELKSWKLSKNSNSTIKKDGKRVTIFKTGDKFKFAINHPRLTEGKFGRKLFDSERSAKLAAFDAMIWLDAHWSEFVWHGSVE